MSCTDWEEFCLQQIFTFTADVLFTTTFTFIDIVNLQEPFFLDRAVICCEQEGEVAAAARDQLDYFEIQEFGNKDSYVFKVIAVKKIWKSSQSSNLNLRIKLLTAVLIWLLSAGGGEFDDGNLVPSVAILQPVPRGVEEEEEGPPQYHGRPWRRVIFGVRGWKTMMIIIVIFIVDRDECGMGSHCHRLVQLLTSAMTWPACSAPIVTIFVVSCLAFCDSHHLTKMMMTAILMKFRSTFALLDLWYVVSREINFMKKCLILRVYTGCAV